jgi:hypothetical protein
MIRNPGQGAAEVVARSGDRWRRAVAPDRAGGGATQVHLPPDQAPFTESA